MKPIPEPNSNTLANNLAERMRLDLLQRGLSVGELFMTEAGVVEKYGVSRNIAREAVSQLRALGVLKSRQARGLIVSQTDPVGLLSRTLPFAVRSSAALDDLAQFRYALETGAIDLAVTQATDSQVDELVRLALEFESLSGQDSEDGAHLAFHTLLLQMTGNPLIAGLHQVIAEYFHEAAHLPTWHHGEPRAVWQHRAIAEAVRQRDTEQARAMLRLHLQPLLG
jgi:GntR family transcriptional regulator, transcriptional repressor for pyruvate dehydrogenase complex